MLRSGDGCVADHSAPPRCALLLLALRAPLAGAAAARGGLDPPKRRRARDDRRRVGAGRQGPDRAQAGRPRPGRDALGPSSSSRSRSATGCGPAPRSRSRPPASSPARAASGARYEINPTITARIVLSPSPKAGSRVPAAVREPQRALQAAASEPQPPLHDRDPEHRDAISDLSALPCPPDACYVNLIVGAQHKKAKEGDVVVLGGDQPDGSVEQDKGRLNVIQAHVERAGADAELERAAGQHRAAADESTTRRSAGSSTRCRSRAAEGEVLAFDAAFVDRDHRPALQHLHLLAGDRRHRPDRRPSRPGRPKTAIPLKGQAHRVERLQLHPGRERLREPVHDPQGGRGALRRDVIDKRTGEPITLYLNVLAGAKPLLAEKGVNENDRSRSRRSPAGSPSGATRSSRLGGNRSAGRPSRRRARRRPRSRARSRARPAGRRRPPRTRRPPPGVIRSRHIPIRSERGGSFASTWLSIRASAGWFGRFLRGSSRAFSARRPSARSW